MCGISGIWLKQASSADLKGTIYRLSQTIKHRGPDGEGFMLASAEKAEAFFSEDTPRFQNKDLNYLPSKHLKEAGDPYRLAFGHRRLSIIDLSESGHQPMCDKEEKLWITFNGEIYNYIELKKELEGLGHRFVSTSDTEVILASYRQWGEACQHKLNGMWAFCIYDKEKQLLFCSRDRFGVKPFYYTDRSGCFAFASEQKALIKSGLVPFVMNEKAVHDHLVNERIESEPEGFFTGILELFPGYQLVVNLNNGTLTVENWYKLRFAPDPSTDALSDEEVIRIIREKLDRAIAWRLRSDVPVGSCLSGGIDSSVIAGLIRQHSKPLFLFTSVFKNDASDESYYAELVAKKVNGNYKTVEPSPEGLFAELGKLVYAQDVPIWSTSTYAQYKVMELAKLNNIKVVLDGQGGDELFAGYHHHFIAKWNGLPGLRAMADIKESARSIQSPFAFYAKEKVKQRRNTHLSKIAPYLTDKFVQAFPVINQVRYFDSVNEQLNNDFVNGRLKSFLKCEDRCGMIHHVESRVPFSDDTDLIEFMFSLDGNRKIRHGVSKYLLREATKDLLPKEVYQRYDKKGFETPMNKWITENQMRLFEKIGNNFEFVNIEKLRASFKKENAGTKEVSLLYKLYVLTIWKELFS